MLQASRKILDYFDRWLEGAGISERERPDYRKWVRFYLDFCDKYGHAPRSRASLGPFLAKLASKNQSAAQKQQASQAVKLLAAADDVAPGSPRAPVVPQASRCREAQVEHPIRSSQRVRPAILKLADGRCKTSPLGGPWPEKQSGATSGVPPILSLRNGVTGEPSGGVAQPWVAGRGASWKREYRELEGAIKMRNYSRKTFAAYRLWARKFQGFVRSKSPGDLDGEDAKGFLTDLAVRQGVAGSTQNQAFNALLFFYRHVLGREFGKLDGVRAKRRPYVPVVLSRSEVDAVLGHLAPPYRLVGTLLYGLACDFPNAWNCASNASILTRGF